MKSKNRTELIKKLEKLQANDPNDFEALALEVFAYQKENNPIYRKFLALLGKQTKPVQTLRDIPFLPIELFKSQTIKTGKWKEEAVFTSSGTTGSTPSRHFIRSLDFYLKQTKRCFEYFYGPIEDLAVLALLPSYLERPGSSLVYMARHFIGLSKHQESGFYLYDYAGLRQTLQDLQKKQTRVLLLGVTFALLEFAERQSLPLQEEQFILMETGGMKGRGPEFTRSEVHDKLQKAFGLRQIHSEYGMTELLSQAYSQGQGLFRPGPGMHIRIRDLRDPFAERQTGHSGGINIIDLANIDSCSFIATQDIGRMQADGTFEVLGRSDNSEMRGCNLLVENQWT